LIFKHPAAFLVSAAITLLVAWIGGVTWFQLHSAQQIRREVGHYYAIVAATDALGMALRDAERGQRGFLMSVEEAYLAPYIEAVGRVGDLSEKLRRLDPSERRLAEVTEAIGRKLDELAQTIELRRSSGLLAALVVVETNLGQLLMDKISKILSAIQAADERDFYMRRAQADRMENRVRWLALIDVGLATVLLLLGARWLAKAERQRTRLEAELRRLNAAWMPE
jgi:CHASE3 domain sensor protein